MPIREKQFAFPCCWRGVVAPWSMDLRQYLAVGRRTLLPKKIVFDRVAAAQNWAPPNPTLLFISGLGVKKRAKPTVEMEPLSVCNITAYNM